MEIKTKEEFYKEFFNEITSVCEATGITHRELAEKVLESLPSAEQVTGKLKNPCDSLLTADSEACKEQKSKLDLISRQAVIELIKNSYYNLAENMDDVWAMVHDVEQLPSAPDSRQRGEWVWKKDAMDWGIGAWVCNKCGCRPNTLWSTKRDSIPLEYAGSRFCGYCGADMKGQNDGQKR